jgi:hypothetical protein
MGLLDKLKFNLWDEVSTISDLIKRWRPRGCKSEKDYEKSFVSHLRGKLPDISVTPQYAVGRTKADLVIGESVIVEIKCNLKTTAQHQRLLGQLTEYATWEGPVFLLLIGETDPDLRQKIQKFADGENSKMENFLDGEKFVILDK